jgi:hypothetical protein
MKSTVPVVFALGLFALQGAAHADPRLADVAVDRREGRILASCRLEDALSPGAEEEIAAGLEVAVEYRLHVYRRRAGLPDALLAKRRVESSVRLDTLTRQYTLTRRIDGELADTRVTPDAGEMREFLTRLRDLPVAEERLLLPDARHYLKIKSNLGLVWRFYLIPWNLSTGWVRLDLGAPGVKGHATQP